MKKLAYFLALALGLALAGCNKMTPEQMAARASAISVKCNPEILTLSCGKVEATVKVFFPKNYFNPEAIMVVTPVLVYEGGEVAAPICVYQGEKVKQNNKTVLKGGTELQETFSFDWIPGMEKSRLELRGVIEYVGTKTTVPPIKVAEGVRTVFQLAELDGFCEFKADNYQKVLIKTAEGKIMYDVNSSTVKNSQLKGESIENYQDKMEDVKKDPRYTVKGTQIVSYTSPEGGKTYNDKLSGNRSNAAQKAWEIIGKGVEAEDLDIKSIGQDWDGFREAVEKSNIKDKDLILRVLSMYSDPAVRESEIKNLSEVYTELRTEVFPQLRRSRFITSLEFENYSEEDLEILAQQKIYMLDEEGLLRLAAVTDADSRKEFLYNFNFQKYGSKRAGFNLAVLAYKAGKPSAAEYYLNQLNDEDDPEVINMRGLIEMKKQNWYKAEDLFEKANIPVATANIGVVNMLQKNYEKAAQVLPDGDPNKAVACLMLDKTAEAAAALNGEDGKTAYLRAIIAAREGNVAALKENVEKAVAKDPSYANRAATDIEFAKYRQ